MDREALELAMASAPLASVEEATFFRSVSLRVVEILGVDILDGAHAGLSSGRYNPAGSEPTCYFAASQTLGCLECEHNLLVTGLQATPALPRLVVSIKLENLTLLDLTNPLVIAHLGIPASTLTIPTNQWRHLNEHGSLAPTQHLGDAARSRADIDGILAPSWFQRAFVGALPRMENLVLFMDPSTSHEHRNPSVSLSIHDPDGLLP